MKLTKKIAGLGLAVAIMISGLNGISERAIAAGKSTDKIAVNILAKQDKNSKKVKASSENIKAHLAYEEKIKSLNPEDYAGFNIAFGEFNNMSFKFAYHDFNKDGIDELVLSLYGVDIYENKEKYVGFSIYTYYKNKVSGSDTFQSGYIRFNSPIIMFFGYSPRGLDDVWGEIVKKGNLEKTWGFSKYEYNNNNQYYIDKEVSGDKWYKEVKKKFAIGKDNIIKTVEASDKELDKYRKTYNSANFKGRLTNKTDFPFNWYFEVSK